MVEFEELEELLSTARVGSRASECHGFLCGFICAGNLPGEDIIRAFLLTDTGSEQIGSECCNRIAELASEVRTQIRSPGLKLQLLLPDDDSPLIDRSIALTEWCQGFLSGLGVAGILDNDSITGESRELIDDLYLICRLDTDEMNSAGADEEAALFELIEYIRMGVILIHEELTGPPVTTTGLKVLH